MPPEREQPEAGSERKDEHARLDAAREATALGEAHITPPKDPSRPQIFDLEKISVYYGEVPAVRDMTFKIYEREITALIGPSGCGKSTFLRCLNRMNDLVPGARVEGRLEYHGQALHGEGGDPIEVRRRIGMVFQKPNPFPKSIFDNVAFGPKVNGIKGKPDEIV